MLNKVSTLLAKKLAENLGEEKEEIYIYGFELIISTFLGLASIMLFSGFMSEVLSGIVFFLVFIPLRLFAGGYHATTYGKCFIISNLSYMIILFLKNITWEIVPIEAWFVILIAMSFYIAKHAPVLNASQPINEYKQNRSRKIAMVILSLDILWISYLALKQKEMMCMAILSICLIFVFMLITDKSIDSHFEEKGGY